MSGLHAVWACALLGRCLIAGDGALEERFRAEMRRIDGQQINRALQAAALLRAPRPSLANQLYQAALNQARHMGPRQAFEAQIRYSMAIRDYRQAIAAAQSAAEAGHFRLDATRELLDVLFSREPRLGADLFAEILARMPAALSSTGDLLFVFQYLRAAAQVDPTLAVQAAERIAGSLERSGPKPPERDTLLFAAGAYLSALDHRRFAWRATQFAPWQDKLRSVTLAEASALTAAIPFPPRGAPVEAPADLVEALQDSLDRAFPLREHRGEIVIVNFWATWCAPCRREMPRLAALAAEWKPRGLTVLGVTDEPESTAAGFLRGNGFAFPNISDPSGALRRAFEVSSLPVLLIFDRNGRNVARLEEPNDSALRSALESAAR